MHALPAFRFLTPRSLPAPASVPGRVAVLDVAFSSEVAGCSFEKTTLPFIRGLGARLVAWVDHHDHDRHKDYAEDPRFVLATKAEHGACPEMVTPEVVRRAGPVDTLAVHLDLDGLYSGAKWILGGVPPYEEADADARAVDTRRGEPGLRGARIDRALRARFRDEHLKLQVIRFLVEGADPVKHPAWEMIDAAAKEIDPLLDEARRLADAYRVADGVAVVDVRDSHQAKSYDKTELLLIGQTRAPISVIRDVGAGSLTIAADFESGFDFVKLLGLGGGMPTRVSVPMSRYDEVMSKLAHVARPGGASAGGQV